MAEDEMTNTSEKISESVLLLAVARVSMALVLPTIGIISFLGSSWLEAKFSAQDQRIVTQGNTFDNNNKLTIARVETVERSAQSAIDQAGAVNAKLSIVETKQNENTVSNDKFQAATLSRLDRVQDSIVGLSNAVSALTAVMQTTLEARKNDGR